MKNNKNIIYKYACKYADKLLFKIQHKTYWLILPIDIAIELSKSVYKKK